MMRNCVRVNFILGDLEQLVGSDLEVLKEDIESDGQEIIIKCDRVFKSCRIFCSFYIGRQCIYFGEIVVFFLKEDNIYGKQKLKVNNLKLKFQVFKGIGCFYGKELVKKFMKEIVVFNNNIKDQNCLKFEDFGGIFMELGFSYVNGLLGELIFF